MNTISDLEAHLARWPLLVDVVFWLTAAILAGILLLYVYLVALHIVNDRRAARSRALRLQWRPLLLQTMAGKRPSQLPELGPRDDVNILDTWYGVRRLVIGPGAARLNRLAVELGLDNIVHRILQYRTPAHAARGIWLQVLGVRVAGAINSPRAQAALENAVEHGSLPVSVAAVCALMENDTEKARLHLLSTMLRFDRWSPFIAHSISRAGGANLLRLLGRQIARLDDRTKRNLLSLIELTDDAELLPFLRSTLRSSRDVTEQATVIRALARLGGVAEREQILPFLRHEHHALRVQAIHAVRRLGSAGDRELLIPMLSDPNWWVRYRAAQALFALRPMTVAETARLRESLPDPRAREMLLHVEAERNL